MGYRSNVDILFYPQLRDNFPVMKLWLDENLPGKDLLDCEVNEESIYIRYSCRDVKWYDGYEEIDQIERAIDTFNTLFCQDNSHIRCEYEMVRIGENTDDIETSYSDGCSWRLYVNRETMVD